MFYQRSLILRSHIVSQIREATYSPSPLIRILHDPSILPPQSLDYAKPLRDDRRNRAPRPRRGREHRTEVIAALAIAEEEKHSRQLKTLLRDSAERLEYEIRRADAATQRAEIAERQEKAYLARAESTEREKDELRKVCNGLERDLRNYQIQLEETQRDLKHLLIDLDEKRKEMEELQNVEARAQAEIRKSRSGMKELQRQLEKQNLEVQNVIQQWYRSGREAGYEQGNDEGYEAGRKAGIKEGLKKGKREGLAEGIDNGKHEEHRNAIEAIEILKSDDQKVCTQGLASPIVD